MCSRSTDTTARRHLWPECSRLTDHVNTQPAIRQLRRALLTDAESELKLDVRRLFQVHHDPLLPADHQLVAVHFSRQGGRNLGRSGVHQKGAHGDQRLQTGLARGLKEQIKDGALVQSGGMSVEAVVRMRGRQRNQIRRGRGGSAAPDANVKILRNRSAYLNVFSK